ncbi:MAG: hypothetical protein RMJ15_04150, partial [Nitrososphaerota archaeon]|nr:hypothetical protein [Nitrososphaerota archaeon]
MNEKSWSYDLRGKPYTLEEKLDELKRALDSIGLWSVKMRDIRVALWKVCGHKFESKEAFEKEWSERKIGRMMKKLGAKRYLKWHMGQKGAR